MDTSAWVEATGSAFAGLGGGGFRRPVNPRLVAGLAGKAAPSSKASALARSARRLIVRTALLTQSVDDLLPPVTPRGRARAVTRSPSIMAQSQPGAAGAAARMQHMAAVQRWLK